MAPTSAPTLAPTTRSGRMPSASSAWTARRHAQGRADHRWTVPGPVALERAPRPGNGPSPGPGAAACCSAHAARTAATSAAAARHGRYGVTCRVHGGGEHQAPAAIDPGVSADHAGIAVPERQSAGRVDQDGGRLVPSVELRVPELDARPWRRGRSRHLAARHHARPRADSACSDSTRDLARCELL